MTWPGEFAGMDRFEARKAVVAKLEEIGALVKIEKRVHSVGHSERTGVVVEPRLSHAMVRQDGPIG